MEKKVISKAVSIALVSLISYSGLALGDNARQKIVKIKEIKEKATKLDRIEKFIHAHESFGAPAVSLGSSILKRDKQYTNAQSVLNNAPGISVTNPGPIASRVHTYVRGFNSTEVGYTFFNLPITSLLIGGLNGGNLYQNDSYGLSPITIGETSGINVLYGPPKPSINSFGAIGGVVNYKPLLPTKKFNAKIFTGYGSFDTRTIGATLNTGNIGNNGGRLLIRYSTKTTNNYFSAAPATTHSYYIAYALPSSSGLSKLTAIWYLNNFNGNIPARMPEDQLNKYGRYYQWPDTVSYSKANGTFMEGVVGYKSMINKHLLFDGKVYYQQQDYKRLEYDNYIETNPYYGDTRIEFSGPYGPQVSYNPGGLSGIEYHNFYVNDVSVGINPSVTFLSKNIEVKAGWLFAGTFGHNGDNLYGTPNMPVIQGYNDVWDEHQERMYNKFYIQADYSPLKNLRIYPGFKYEIVNTVDNDVPGIFYPVGATVGNTYGRPSAYLGASYHLNTKTKVFANYALAYKYPNMSAYYGLTGQANVGVAPPAFKVVPEFVNSYQLGILYKNSGFIASLTGYKDYFQNTFSTLTHIVSGINYQINSGASDYEGINIATAYQLNNDISIYGNFSLQKGVYTSGFSNQFGYSVTSGMPKQYTPTYLANIGINANFERVSGSLWSTMTGPQYIGTLGGSPAGVSMPGYATLNMSLKYKIPVHHFGIKKVTLGLNIENILNSNSYVFEKEYPYHNISGTYIEAQPMSPRFIGVNLGLSF